MYQKLGFESLRVRRWYRNYSTRSAVDIPLLNKNYNFLIFFPFTNKLDPGLRKAMSLPVFKINIFKFTRPSPNLVYNCHNPKGLKFITRLRLGLIYLREHNFKHSFQDTINLLCCCSLDIKSTEHFLLDCSMKDKLS